MQTKKEAPAATEANTLNECVKYTPEILNDELPMFPEDAAHWWLEFGFNVVPISPAKKLPTVKWQPWLDRLTHDSITKQYEKQHDDVGAIIDHTIMVLDADSEESLSALLELEKAHDVAPNLIVKTSKGQHHFFKREPGTYAKQCGFSTDKHPTAIDVKTGRSDTEGRSIVVLPPSTNKTILINEAATADDLTTVGQQFIDAVFKHNGMDAPRPPVPADLTKSKSRAGKHEVREILEYIDPESPNGKGYDGWIECIMGVKNRCNGDPIGIDLLDDWSSAAANYCGREVIEYKYDSFDSDMFGGVTFRSVADMAKQVGADLSAISKKYDANGDPIPTYQDLLEEAKEMDSDTAPSDIEALAKRCSHLTGIEQTKVFKVLKNSAGANLSDLRGIAKSAQREAKKEVITQGGINNAIEPMPIYSFPDVAYNEENGQTRLLPTKNNVRAMLQHYKISVYYDVIKKKAFIRVPGLTGSPDNADNSALTECISLAKLNEIATDQVPAYIMAIADDNQRNPVADWILSKAWDGQDRLSALLDTLELKADYPADLRDMLVTRWLISAVAAGLKPIGFKARGVLTFQGAQSIGKTSWLESLVPDLALRKQLIKTDHLLDPTNKDTVLAAISHWLVELGELDSTFKKDVARLKGLITADMDKIRRPYAALDSEYQRRTVFFASVNDSNFLVDDTGNTRFWTIAVKRINYQHNIDMQQLWAQIATYYEQGEQWWLTREEEQRLEAINKGHRVTTAVRDLINSELDWQCSSPGLFKRQSAAQVLRGIGFDKPSNAQCKEAGAVLREIVGEPTKSGGNNVWLVPPLQMFQPE